MPQYSKLIMRRAFGYWNTAARTAAITAAGISAWVGLLQAVSQGLSQEMLQQIPEGKLVLDLGGRR
jgi:hypothetical protein